MVKQELRISNTQQEMMIMDGDLFGQFYIGMLFWYEEEVMKPRLFFEGNADEPPNLAYLFDFPNETAEKVLKLFPQGIFPDDPQAVEKFNRIYVDVFEGMIHDARVVLDNERMFYMYQDSNESPKNFFNLPIKEVW